MTGSHMTGSGGTRVIFLLMSGPGLWAADEARLGQEMQTENKEVYCYEEQATSQNHGGLFFTSECYSQWCENVDRNYGSLAARAHAKKANLMNSRNGWLSREIRLCSAFESHHLWAEWHLGLHFWFLSILEAKLCQVSKDWVARAAYTRVWILMASLPKR